MDMDNNHHNHVFDPALTHSALDDDKQKQLAQVLSVNPSDASTSGNSSNSGTAAGQLQADGTPVKRRPGRPKGSTKKNLLGNESPVPLKIKRPVGRPRKDGFPAGSVVPRIKREKTAGLPQGVPMVQYGTPMPGIGYPPIAFGYAPLPPPGIPPPPPMFPLDPSLAAPEGDDWAELARTNSNAFLSTLLAALAAPNPIAHAGQSVEEAFKSHLASLQPKATNNSTMYTVLRTFWMPCSPAFFALTASGSTVRWPEYRFLYWDPQPLAFNGIACPNCSAPLINKGRITSGPVKIYDLDKPFFIIGCEYVCQSPVCIAAVSSSEGRKFASTDQSILRSLPVLLKGEFPARLLNGNADAGSGPNVWNWRAMGVSTNLWNLVMSALKCGLRKEVILRMIWAVQNKMPEFPMENSGAPGAGQQQSQQSGGDQQDKMEEEDDDNEADGDDHEPDGGADHHMASGSSQPQPQPQSQSQSQTLSSSASFPEASNNAWAANSSMTDSTSMSNTHMKGPATPVPTVPPQVQSPLRKPATPARSGVAAGVTSPPPHPSTPALPTVPSSASPQRHEQPQQPPLRPHSQAQSRSQESQTPAPAPTPAPPEAQPQPSAQQTLQPPPPPVGAGYTPYGPYPFTPYAYHFVNGALVPANLNLLSSSSMSLPMSAFPPSHPPTSTSGSGSTSSPGPGPMVASSSSSSSHSHLPMPIVPSHHPLGPGVPVAPPPPPQGGTPISGTKRSPRHCVKCGSQDCKGKGGRSFCTNGCQDCGKVECKGRNSRRPDKKCSEGWT